MYFTICTLAACTTTQSSLAEDFSNTIKQRQQTFKAIEAFIDDFEKPISNIEWEIINKKISELAKLTHQLPELFPPGSSEDSKSKEKIWDSKQDFNHRLAELNNAFNNMQQASLEKKWQLLTENYKIAKNSCNSCHRKYRSLW